MTNNGKVLTIKRGIITIDNIVAFIFSLRAITFVWLAFASDLYIPVFASMVQILRYITIPIGLAYLIKQREAERSDLKLLLPLIFYYILLVLHTYGGYQGSYIHELFSIGCFLLMSREMKIRVFSYFYKIILFSCVISIFVYIAYMLHLPIGFSRHPFYNDGVQSSYYQKWLIFAVMDSGYSIPRLCGIFNEPGGLGTVCGLLFAATFKFSSRREKIILVITILLSMSLAGVLLLFIYLIIYLAQRNWKNAVVAVGLFVFLLMIPKIDWGNSDINAFAQRFAFTASGLAGDNRTRSQFDVEFTQLLHSNEVFFGKGAAYTAESGTASYKNYIVQFGVIGFGIYILLWINSALSVAKMNKECLILLLVFLVSIYQRPVPLTNAYGYLVIFGGFLWIQDQEDKARLCSTSNA